MAYFSFSIQRQNWRSKTASSDHSLGKVVIKLVLKYDFFSSEWEQANAPKRGFNTKILSVNSFMPPPLIMTRKTDAIPQLKRKSPEVWV